MRPRLVLTLLPVLWLAQCTGPGTPALFRRPLPAYPESREQQRSEQREEDRELQTVAYQRGQEEGLADARAGAASQPGRVADSLPAGQSQAYQAGYQEGYTRGSATGVPAADPAYSQGYDYGLRDRVAGRPADPAAHAGRYDPRHRASFERGYLDAYESAR